MLFFYTKSKLRTMKRSGIIILAVLALLFFWGKGAYNKLVTSDEDVKKSWGNVQTQYQRRMDLIDNLVETVKGEANFEQETLENVIKARASATSMQVNANDLNQEQLNELNARQGQLSQALGRLMVVVEKYPTLRANDAFRNLQVALEGTENRINTARVDYNNSVNKYNVLVRKFPGNMMAGIFGFSSKPLFEADEAAQNAPKVDFSDES